jgi:ABC-2 type transport system permease protein
MHWVGLKTLIFREFGVSVRFWSVTLAPPVITTIRYFTIFGEVIGGRIGSIDGVDYIKYLAPGLIVLWVSPYSFGHTAGGLLGARHFRYIEEFLVSPQPDWVIMAAGGDGRRADQRLQASFQPYSRKASNT